MHPRFASVLAVLVPLLLVAVVAAELGQPKMRTASVYSQAIDAGLTARPPEWIIVGNSKAKQDVDRRQLAEDLSFSGNLEPVVLNGSTAPGWYAMLEQRVFGEGHRPKLVLVYGQLGAMLRNRPLTDTEVRNIEGLTDKPSAILESRVFGQSAHPIGRSQARAFRLHEDAVVALRELTVGALFGDSGPWRATGRAESSRAWASVFGPDAAVRTTGNTRMVPGAADLVSAPAVGAVGTEFVEDILRLCQAAGARVVFVRAPVATHVRSRDAVPEAVEAALYAHLNAANASWIDLHAIDLPAGAFRDDFHLLPAGAQALTSTLAARMLAADIVNGGVIRAVPPFRSISVTREGSAPTFDVGAPAPMQERACGWRATVAGTDALSDEAVADAGLGRTGPFVVEADGTLLSCGAAAKAFGETCSGSASMRAGEVRVSTASGAAPRAVSVRVTESPSVTDESGTTTWWVPPGTTLRWRFEAPPAGKNPTVSAVVRALKGRGATLWVEGVATPFRDSGRVMRAESPIPAGAWSVGIEAAPDTWLVVHSLAAVGAERNFVVGAPWAESHLLQSRPIFATEPVPVPVEAVEAGAGLWRVDLPQWASLADDTQPSRCSPVEVSAANAPFGKATHSTRARLAAGGTGSAHEGGALWVRSAAPPDRARLNPERSCIRGGKYFPGWLYDGDVGRVTVSGVRIRAHPLGIDTLRVDGVARGGDVTLTVTVRKRKGDGWATEWSGSLVFSEAEGRIQHELALEPALPLSEGKRTVELAVKGGHLLTWSAVLSESEGVPGL